MRVKETTTELMSVWESHGKIRESTRYKHAHKNIIQRIPTVSPGVFSQKLRVPFCGLNHNLSEPKRVLLDKVLYI